MQANSLIAVWSRGHAWAQRVGTGLREVGQGGAGRSAALGGKAFSRASSAEHETMVALSRRTRAMGKGVVKGEDVMGGGGGEGSGARQGVGVLGG